MIKSTAKALKQEAQFFSKEEVKTWLKENGLKVVGYPKRLAYCESLYGCGGYLLSYTLNNGSTITAFTGRSTWMYSCENHHDLGVENYV